MTPEAAYQLGYEDGLRGTIVNETLPPVERRNDYAQGFRDGERERIAKETT